MRVKVAPDDDCMLLLLLLRDVVDVFLLLLLFVFVVLELSLVVEECVFDEDDADSSVVSVISKSSTCFP
jgi:hypothetical protein